MYAQVAVHSEIQHSSLVMFFHTHLSKINFLTLRNGLHVVNTGQNAMQNHFLYLAS